MAIEEVVEKVVMDMDIERCKGCGLCVANCPKKAISLTKFPTTNIAGNSYIVVDNEKCTGCGICANYFCGDGVFKFIEVKE